MKTCTFLFLALVACTLAAKFSVTVDFDQVKLGELAANEVYEGWIKEGAAAPVSTGTFVINATTPDEITMETDAITALPADDALFILTIEPANDPDPAPSAQKLVSGTFASSSARVDTDLIWGVDAFATIGGQFFLATPTSAATDDDCQGIWMFTPPSTPVMLPNAPEGFTYEGWVVNVADPNSPMPMTTGLFNMTDGPDSDGAGPFSGPLMGPNYPGQDFVMNTTKDLCSNYMVVISVEPFPDPNPAMPFFLKPLNAVIQNTTGTSNLQDFTRDLSMLPSFMVTVTAPSTDVPTAAPTAAVTPTEDPSPAAKIVVSLFAIFVVLFALF